MDRLRGLLAQLRAVLRGRSADRDLDDEIRSHIEMETEKNLAAGMPPGEARRRALAVFGGRDAAMEGHRDVRGGRWVSDMISDTRFALRTLRHNPVLTVAAVLTLALGVGANTAIFSTLHAVVLRPLPFHESQRLVMLYETNAERGWTQAEAAPANYFDWREQVDAFEDIAAYQSFGSTTVLSHNGEAQLLSTMTVTGNFFSVLRAPAALGRTFTDEETWTTGERIAMISHRLWMSRFGGDSSLVGRTISLGGFPVRVVGVVSPSYSFPGWKTDVWRPTALDPAARNQVSFRRAHWWRAIARVKPGISLAQANTSFQVVVQRLQRDYPVTNTDMGAGMMPLHRFLVGEVRQPLLALQVAVGLLLLIACANVGNLLLVRAADRERESVVRLALGAGSGRLVRQALSESLVLSTLGGLSGVALGWAGTRLLAAMQPDGMLPVGDIEVNTSVLLFALTVSVLSGLLFGIGPAVWAGRRAPAEVLKEGGRGTSRTQLRRWSYALAVARDILPPWEMSPPHCVTPSPIAIASTPKSAAVAWQPCMAPMICATAVVSRSRCCVRSWRRTWAPTASFARSASRRGSPIRTSYRCSTPVPPTACCTTSPNSCRADLCATGCAPKDLCPFAMPCGSPRR